MKKRIITVIALSLLLCISLASCKRNENDEKVDKVENKTSEANHSDNDTSQLITETQHKSDFALNTIINITLFEAPKFGEEDWQQTMDVLRNVESTMSAHTATSLVSEINNNAGIKPVQVSDDLYEVIKMAKNIAEETNGAFDPTVGALTKLWQIGTDEEHVPSPEEIDNGLSKVDYKKIILDDAKKTVFLEEEGMSIDLGGIAKGYSADKSFDYLSNKGVKKAILDFGGNISLIGSKDEENSWRVGIRKPDRNTAELIVYAAVSGKDESVVSSGDYERFFEEDGKFYHHIISPYTGYPTDNEIRGASVILPSSMQADAYATALMVMGKEKAIAFIEDKGLETCLIFDDMSSYSTFDEKRKFEILE